LTLGPCDGTIAPDMKKTATSELLLT